MFTGIIQNTSKIKKVISKPGLKTLVVKLNKNRIKNLKIGASVAVNGVCLTVTSIHKNEVSFDVMQETMNKTTLGSLKKNSRVNIERSLKQGDELGGHLLSGHIDMTATIKKITKPENNTIIEFDCSKKWMKYIFDKGFIAINGASLTIVKTFQKGGFTVHLIPETLKATTFASLAVGNKVNIEIDRQTQAIVNTVEHYLNKNR
ncbi:MAG: riboflavin synthase subunit alpha [Gammaproteobacteria bacterium]|nr:riboflavin synthase subunit alpha [Gammaproteobacteria bacterium]